MSSYCAASFPQKRKFESEMAEKTPVSLLQELCIQETGISLYTESIPHDSNPKLFACFVEAFGQTTIGSGHSKKEAKHEACAKLIGKFIILCWFT